MPDELQPSNRRSHAWQVMPPGAQAAALRPVHTLPVQHPVEQLVALQRQAPPTHCCPVAHGPPVEPQTQAPAALQVSATIASQATQAAPPMPQVEVDGCDLHCAPSQQPLGQLAALHAQTPPSQY